jgi:hypothetical protein
MPQQEKALRTLSILYALVLLFSFLPYLDFHLNIYLTILEFTVVLIALGTILFRFQLTLFPALLSAYILFFLLGLPEHPNHRYLLFFLSLSFLPLAIRIYQNDCNMAYEYFSKQIIPFSRILCLMVYFFAFFAKLNQGYLDPETSCSVVFVKHVHLLYFQWIFPEFPDALGYISIYMSILTELLLLPLLYFPRTRLIGVLAGIIFHYFLALDTIKYFINFSSVMYLLLLIVGGELYFSRLFSERIIRTSTKLIFPFALFFFIFFLSSKSSLSGNNGAQLGFSAFVTFSHYWLLLALLLIARYLTVTGKELLNPSLDASSLHPFNRNFSFPMYGWHYALLILVLAYGVSPYLGLKTRISFTMYSNLWFDKDTSNHLLLKSNPDLLSALRIRGTILKAPEDPKPRCSQKLKQGLQYPVIELARYAKSCQMEEFEFEHHYRIFTSNSPEAEKLFSHHSNLITRTLLVFGPIGPDAVKECIW